MSPYRQETGRGGSCAVHVLLAALAGAALTAFPLLHDPAAYFIDDMQAQYMPTFYAVGHTLRETGGLPFLTVQNWYGGNLAGEYQYALFNPIALALYAVLPSFGTLAAGAGFLAVSVGAILGAGVYVLARALGIARAYAYLAAAALVTNNFVFYWYASSWFPAFLSLAFMVWAMAFVLRADEGAGPFLGAGAAVYLTATSGWPHAMIVLGLFVGIRLAVLVAGGRWRRALIASVPALLGVAAALPAVVPMIGMGSMAGRTVAMVNNGFLVPNLGDVLAVGNPFHQGHMLSFSGFGKMRTPFFYAAWFIVPVLCLLDWRRVDWRRPHLILLLVFTGILLFATQGPAHLGPMRFPFRFVSYFHFALVLAVLSLLSQAGFAAYSRQRGFILIGVLFVTALHSAQVNPPLSLWIFAAAAVAATVAFYIFLRVRRTAAVAGVMILTTVAFAFFVRLAAPHNMDVPDWHFARAPESVHSLWRVPSSWTFFANGHGDHDDAKRFDETLFGQMGLALGMPTVNGYSPFDHRGLHRRFCMDTHGWTCPDAAAALMKADSATGATFADLMRVGRIVVARGAYLDRFRQHRRVPWRVVHEGPRAVVYARALPNGKLPGTLAWPLSGMTAEAVGTATATREAIAIRRRNATVRTLLFARPYWSGYRATFGGKEIPVRAYDDLLVAVDLPPGTAAGELVLSYRPAGFGLSLWVAAGAVLCLLGGVVPVRRRARLSRGSACRPAAGPNRASPATGEA